jgi:hypothetical protein
MSRHLTGEEIERYVSRQAGVDEILAAAEHLDTCFDCRDRAAALVDDGSHDRPHGKARRLVSLPPTSRRGMIIGWSVAAALVIAIAIVLLSRY